MESQGDRTGVASEEARWPTTRYRRQDRGGRTLTASEAAALIGVSVATVRGWADQGRLPSHRTVGGHRRFDMAELRSWLAERGAPTFEPDRLRHIPQDVPACPELARELNARTEAIVDRAIAGYDEAVPTALPAPSPAALRRSAIRFVRVVAAALEAGRAATSAGRAELAGFRGGMQGDSGASVVIEHTRLALAVMQEAEDAVHSGAVTEPLALETLNAVIDVVQLSVIRGYEQATSGGGATSQS
jgi:excisionase family DNA binding protein